MVAALVDSGCEAELIISGRFAQRHGIAAAEIARSRGGIALTDDTILVATETKSLELEEGGVKSTFKALIPDRYSGLRLWDGRGLRSTIRISIGARTE
jgi:hypothetical protein